MGRKSKENAIKSGQLKSDLQRFSFIAQKDVVADLKKLAQKEGKTIKELMNEILREQIVNRGGVKSKLDNTGIPSIIPKKKNEALLLQALINKKR